MSGKGPAANSCKFVNFSKLPPPPPRFIVWNDVDKLCSQAMVESDVISNCCWCSSNRKKSCASSLLVHASAEIEERRA